MERFFTQHSVLRDRDADELAGRARSDSEASSSDGDSDSGGQQPQRASERVHSVHDPSGPWRQTPVENELWGQPAGKRAGRKARDFRSQHTGPKGVLNDYKAHKRSVRDERARTEQERRDVLHRIATGVSAIPNHTIATTSNSNPTTATPIDCCCTSDDSDCDCDDLVDAAFLQQYQHQRLQELTAAANNRPMFGSLQVISPAQFVALADAASLTTQRIVHLFDTDTYACSLLNTHLAVVAQSLPYVQFTAMVAKDADASIAASDVPVLLFYTGATLDDTIVNVIQALDGDFTLERIGTFIRTRLGVFNSRT